MSSPLRYVTLGLYADRRGRRKRYLIDVPLLVGVHVRHHPDTDAADTAAVRREVARAAIRELREAGLRELIVAKMQGVKGRPVP